MFGKPQWFRPKRIGWGLVPVTWQGWGYTAAWTAAMVLPFLLLLARHQAVEAMLWMALSIGAVSCDVWHILRTFRGPAQQQVRGKHAQLAATNKDDRVLYIGDTDPVATRSYDLCPRR